MKGHQPREERISRAESRIQKSGEAAIFTRVLRKLNHCESLSKDLLGKWLQPISDKRFARVNKIMQFSRFIRPS